MWSEVYQCIAVDHLQEDWCCSPSVSTLCDGHYRHTGGTALLQALVCGWLLKFELHQDSAICFAILSYVTVAMCLVPPNTQAIIKPSEATSAVRSHDHCYLPFFWFSSIRPCIFSLGFAMSPLQKSESQIWPCPGQRWWWWCSFPWQPNTALCMPVWKVVPIAKGWRTPVRRKVNRKQDWLWGGGVG